MRLKGITYDTVKINVFPSFSRHGVNALYRQDVALSTSTDNRTLTPITPTEQYRKLAATFGWNTADFLRCNVSALNAAFVPQSIKEALIKRVIQAYEKA